MRTLVILSGMTFEIEIVAEGESGLQLVTADFREREDRCSSVTESKGYLGAFCVSEDSFGLWRWVFVSVVVLQASGGF